MNAAADLPALAEPPNPRWSTTIVAVGASAVLEVVYNSVNWSALLVIGSVMIVGGAVYRWQRSGTVLSVRLSWVPVSRSDETHTAAPVRRVSHETARRLTTTHEGK